jgi:hypothetical protein
LLLSGIGLVSEVASPKGSFPGLVRLGGLPPLDRTEAAAPLIRDFVEVEFILDDDQTATLCSGTNALISKFGTA